jgi:hypothetical protein
MRRIITVCCCLLAVLMCDAQKKEISQARTYIKNGKDKDLSSAEKLMTDLLAKDSANRQNPRIYATWYDAALLQYESANEKLYLKQKYDTVQFFSLIRKLYQIAESLDSLDARPDKKGRVRPEYREDHASQLNLLRRNLYYGGTFQVRKAQYADAYSFFDTYLDADSQPLFTGYDYLKRDSLMVQAAYWATFCGYKLQQPDSTLRYHHLALRDTAKREFTLQYVCEACRQQQNDSALVATLQQGYEEYPEHPYFFPRLADHYTSLGLYDRVLELTARGLKINPRNQLFLLAQSVAQLNAGNYEDCLQTSEQLIAVNDTMPEAYFNVATAHLNQALALEKENEPRKNRLKLIKLYQDARPYMEAYRKLAPDQKRRWAPALYRVYLNLNMGKQFDEIDKVLKKLNN